MPNRTVCQVLEEIRKCDETGNYSYLISLVEEVQTLANRMEAAIWDQHDIKRLREERTELKKEIKMLKKKKLKLGGKKKSRETPW